MPTWVAAREVRYTFFSELAAKLGAGRVAVGHTAGDQVETVLMHFIRGSGTRGLTGLQPETVLRPGGQQLTVIRPILSLNRAETEAYCKNQGLEWRTDSSNLLPGTQRNSIRLELLPLLRKYNPEIEQAIIRIASIAGDDAAFIDASTQEVWRGIVKESSNPITIDKPRFLVLPLSLQRSLLRQAVASLAGDLRNIELKHIDDIMSIMGKGAGKRIILPEGLVFTTSYRDFTLRKGSESSALLIPFESKYQINIPGETIVPGWRIEAGIGDTHGCLCPNEGSLTAFFDFDKTGEELFVRGRRPGDRFVPLGMTETKTVAEFLIDAKVSKAERASIPVVKTKNQIVWLAGVRMDERVKITELTKRVVRLSFERI